MKYDERIIRAVEEDAETRIINTLTEKTLDVISTKESYYSKRRDFSPLKEMAMNVVKDLFEQGVQGCCDKNVVGGGT